MNYKKDIVKRIEIIIPNNDNTKSIFLEIVDEIEIFFSGYTLLETSEDGGVYISEDGKEYHEKSYLFIVYYCPIKVPEAEEYLKLLTSKLVSHKEDEAWIISHNTDRMICAK